MPRLSKPRHCYIVKADRYKDFFDKIVILFVKGAGNLN